MSTIARQIAGASPAERLAEFQRIEPNLRKQFQEHLVKEGRPGDFDKEFPAILEQAKERALSSPTFGQQAARHAANCRCESHAPPAAPQPGDVVRRIAGPAPRAEVDASKVTAQELTAAMESLVKPKFTKWCAEEKVADAEAEWKTRLPKLTEDFKASKHFGTGVLAVRESIRRCNESLEHVKAKFDQWAATEGLSPEQAAQEWETKYKAKAEARIGEKEAAGQPDREARGRAAVRSHGDAATGRNAEMRGQGIHAQRNHFDKLEAHEKVPYCPTGGGGWPVPHSSRDIGKAERKGRPGEGARTPSPYGANKKERKGIRKAADEISKMEGQPSAKALIDQVLEG